MKRVEENHCVNNFTEIDDDLISRFIFIKIYLKNSTFFTQIRMYFLFVTILLKFRKKYAYLTNVLFHEIFQVFSGMLMTFQFNYKAFAMTFDDSEYLNHP